MDLELIGVGIADRGFLPLWTSPSQFFFFFFSNSFPFLSFLFFSFLPLCVLAPLRLCVPFFSLTSSLRPCVSTGAGLF
jgi:hypothetical protein